MPFPELHARLNSTEYDHSVKRPDIPSRSQGNNEALLVFNNKYSKDGTTSK